jgi:hypothetical protein
MRGGAKHVFVVALLEYPGRAAVVQDQEPFHFLGRRRHREAVAGTHVPHHRVDLFAVVEVLQFLDLLGGAAGLVDVDRLDLQAAEALLVVRGRRLTGVEGFDQDFGAIDRGDAETFGGLPREEADHAYFEGFLGLHRRLQGKA